MKRKYLILFSLAGLVVSLDQLTKQIAHAKFALGESFGLVPGLVEFLHYRNNGFAFGLLQRAPKSVQEVFFVGIPIFALVLIVLIFIKLRDNQTLSSLALTCILGGAVGNLIDRLQYGYVVDVFRLHLGGVFSLPPFNFADAAIISGVVLLFRHSLKNDFVKGTA